MTRRGLRYASGAIGRLNFPYRVDYVLDPVGKLLRRVLHLLRVCLNCSAELGQGEMTTERTAVTS